MNRNIIILIIIAVVICCSSLAGGLGYYFYTEQEAADKKAADKKAADKAKAAADKKAADKFTDSSHVKLNGGNYTFEKDNIVTVQATATPESEYKRTGKGVNVNSEGTATVKRNVDGSLTVISTTPPPPPAPAPAPPAQSIDIGKAIKCSKNSPKGNDAIYRYIGGEAMRWYPNPNTAGSWDSNYSNFQTVDCTGFTLEMDMVPITKTNLGPLKCKDDSVDNPSKECLNTIAYFCRNEYVKGNSTNKTTCKNLLDQEFSKLNPHWKSVLASCAPWKNGDPNSQSCKLATDNLKKNAYYKTTSGQIPISDALIMSVNTGLWDNSELR